MVNSADAFFSTFKVTRRPQILNGVFGDMLLIPREKINILDLWTPGFPDAFLATLPAQGAAISMQDRFGNSLTMTRERSTGNLQRITTSNGRWVSFTYDAASHITQAQDNAGRTVTYCVFLRIRSGIPA